MGTDDYLILNGAFDTEPSSPLFDARADIDGDQYVGTDDYLLLSGSFDLTGENP